MGRSFHNLLLTQAAGDRNGAFFEYDDCGSFEPKACPASIEVGNSFICSPNAVIDDSFGVIPLRRSKLRGALVADLGQGTVWVYTDTTAVSVPGRTHSSALGAVVESLRPLGGHPSTHLPAPRFPTWLVAELDRTVKLYRQLHSLVAVHRRLHISRYAVRDRLNYARIVHSFRPLLQIRCRRHLRPAPPNTTPRP